MQIDLPSGAKESLWRDALASNVNGRIEVKLASGRAAVVTSNEVFEVDKPTNRKEGMGQALAYAQELNRKPVLALTSYSRGPAKLIKNSRARFDLAEKALGQALGDRKSMSPSTNTQHPTPNAGRLAIPSSAARRARRCPIPRFPFGRALTLNFMARPETYDPGTTPHSPRKPGEDWPLSIPMPTSLL